MSFQFVIRGIVGTFLEYFLAGHQHLESAFQRYLPAFQPSDFDIGREGSMERARERDGLFYYISSQFRFLLFLLIFSRFNPKKKMKKKKTKKAAKMPL
jgi:hypothetical protein